MDRYDVEAEIGRGGNAVVYRARDRDLDRIVAIKLIREDIASPTVVSRFHQEIQVTASLEHAHILHIYDTGSFEGRPFVVMELAPGPSLATRLSAEGHLPVADALKIAREVGEALAHAHASGVVHRDVKPENILLTPAGAFIADFGIARIMQERTVDELTSTGVAVGTVLYMSPEQLCADRNIDGRSDQYSLSCLLYEMLAGIRPHIAASVEGLRVLRTMGQQVPVSAHRPSVPPNVSDAIARAMSPIPADRFRTIGDFVAQLDSSAPTDSWPTGARGGDIASNEQEVRRRWAMGLSTVVVVATIAIGGVLYNTATAPEPSTTSNRRVVVEAFQNPAQSISQRERDLSAALRAELLQWKGVQVVDRLARSDTLGLTILPSISFIGDSARLVILVNEGRAKPAREISRIVSVAELAPAVRVMGAVAIEVFGGINVGKAEGIEFLPERNLSALASYVQGFESLHAGRFASAALYFRNVLSSSPHFAQALFWEAQTNAWQSPVDVDKWKANAEQAVRSGTLHGTDSLLAAALLAMSQRDYPTACARYFSAVSLAPASFVGWFGLGECARLDSTVVRRPEGWRFRSSHWEALRAYREAVKVVPSSQLLAGLYPWIWRTTYASGSRVRNGRADDPRGSLFTASPALDADSISLIPIPRAEINAMGKRALASSWYAALRRGRGVAMDLTKIWVERFPDAHEAWLQRATSLEVAGRVAGTGDQSVADALTRAAAGAHTPIERARVAIVRARLGLRMGDVASAAGVARNILTTVDATEQSVRDVLAPLAALIGDDSTTRAFYPLDRERDSGLPAILSDSLNIFWLRAQIGDCLNLHIARMNLDSLFTTRLPAAELAGQRQSRLRAPYRDAVPCLGPALLREFQPTNPLEETYAALAAGDAPRARIVLNGLSKRRAGATMAAFTWDYLYAEAWARRAAGDTTGAQGLVLSALADIENMSMSTLEEVPQAASFRRALLLLRDMQTDSDVNSPGARWAAKAALLGSPIAGASSR